MDPIYDELPAERETAAAKPVESSVPVPRATTRNLIGRRRLPDPRSALYDSLLKDEQVR